MAEIRALVEEYRRETPGEYQRAVARSIEERAEHDVPWLVDRVARVEAERDQLRKAAVRAAIILEGLNMAVVWELAPPIMAEIRNLLPSLRAALAAATPKRPDYSIVHVITAPDAPEEPSL